MYFLVFLIGLVFLGLRIKPTNKSSPPNRPFAQPRTNGDWYKPYDPTQRVPQSTVLVAPVLQGTANVIDGDTVVIRKTQIRLFGIDAPELNHPYGNKAKWALVAMCKGQTIQAELVEKDTHGRTVARCYLSDGRDLSEEMVRAGLAIDWPKYSGGKYSSMETPDARRKLWLANARQKGRLDVWEKFDARSNHLR